MTTHNRHNITDDVKRGAKDVRDSAAEAMHRSAAEAEHERRETEGDLMTPGEKAASIADEVKERGKAGVDHAKRSVRDNT